MPIICAVQEHKFLVRWHPFQLNPQASEEGISKLDFYNNKFGKERTQQMIPFMTVRPADPGIQLAPAECSPPPAS